MTGDETSFGFTFDHIFNEESNQDDIFNSVANPLIEDVLEGYNATIFAYGQTASGKTFTMEGVPGGEAIGIIPRSIQSLFSSISEDFEEHIEFVIKVGGYRV